jgi:diguanylate cyclase (GGDEF)-like protein
VGDDLLCQVGARLQQSVRSSDIVGRHSQDKFMIILTELTSDRSKDREKAQEIPVPRRAGTVAERLLQEFTKPFDAQGNPLHLQISIGVSICPGESNTPQELLEHAEVALTQARLEEGPSYTIYRAAYTAIIKQQQEQAEHLQGLLNDENLEFCLEPLVSFETNTILAVMLKPQPTFAVTDELSGDPWEVADSIGLGPQMFDWLLRSNQRLANQLGERASTTCVILPIQPRQLLNADLGSLLKRTLQGFGGNVVLRIPEIAIVSEARKRSAAVRRLQELGFHILLESGPRGIQSLPVLQQLKPRYLELSPTLMAGLPGVPSSLAMLRACCLVARELGVEIVARGVKTEEQRLWLQEHGCQLGLGPEWRTNLGPEALPG